jgi:hypothetical protein
VALKTTIWQPALNNGAGGVAFRRSIVGYDPAENPLETGVPIYGEPVYLERLTGAEWVRPTAQWSDPARRADPYGTGAIKTFQPGERILNVVDVHPVLGPYDREGAMGAGVPDLDAGTITYTWATIRAAAFDPATHKPPVFADGAWAAAVAKTTEELAAEVVAARAKLKAEAATRRWEVETGGIIRNGLTIATDQLSQTKIGGALQLVQADDQIEIRWKGPAGWVGMDATTVPYVAEQIGLHVQAAFAREEAICLAIDADTPVNILTGAIDGVGAWPT